MDKTCDEEHILKLKVKTSAVSSGESGVARMHSSHLDCFDDEVEHEMVVLKSEENTKVVKLVSDKLAPINTITLREGDQGQMEQVQI
mgnify:CR=1 FL=1